MTSFTATPEPGSVPPRVRLDLDTEDAAASFVDLTVKRNGKAIREQPYAGGSVALAYDYEAPFGVVSTYTVEGSILPPAAADWTESWASLAAWSGSTASWSVASGRASTPVPAETITRSASGTIGRVSVQNPSNVKVALLDASDAVVVSVGYLTSAGVHGTNTGVTLTADTTELRTVTGLEQDFVAVLNDGTVTVTAADGSWSMESTFEGIPVKVALTKNGGSTAQVETIAVTLAGTPEDYSDTTTATLDVDGAWLIHPSQPSLSCLIDTGAAGAHLTYVEASSGEQMTSAAQRTIHRPTGRRRPVVVTHGPREADEWTLTVTVPTNDARASVRAIVDDQTPLLLRVPPTFGWDLPDDWYSVGDFTSTKLIDFADPPYNVTLPLTPVDEPIVRQGSLRTYGDVLLDAETYGDLPGLFDTYLALLAGDAA